MARQSALGDYRFSIQCRPRSVATQWASALSVAKSVQVALGAQQVGGGRDRITVGFDVSTTALLL